MKRTQQQRKVYMKLVKKQLGVLALQAQELQLTTDARSSVRRKLADVMAMTRECKVLDEHDCEFAHENEVSLVVVEKLARLIDKKFRYRIDSLVDCRAALMKEVGDGKE